MIKIENIDVYGFINAFRGMRNPLESWGSGDSIQTPDGREIAGKNDLALGKKLVLAGTDHSKFMRQIYVSMDITAPLYWWKEFDTYKIGTTANSCSTMHKLATTPITRECFSFDEELLSLDTIDRNGVENFFGKNLEELIEILEFLRQKYLETKDKHYWRALIQMLPSSWNQKRTVQLNYQVIRNMLFARELHKLSEWRTLCMYFKQLPYAPDLISVK